MLLVVDMRTKQSDDMDFVIKTLSAAALPLQLLSAAYNGEQCPQEKEKSILMKYGRMIFL